jgi:hypothetical protein
VTASAVYRSIFGMNHNSPRFEQFLGKVTWQLPPLQFRPVNALRLRSLVGDRIFEVEEVLRLQIVTNVSFIAAVAKRKLGSSDSYAGRIGCECWLPASTFPMRLWRMREIKTRNPQSETLTTASKTNARNP